MRLLLLPVTTQRTLIYCQRLSLPPVRSKPRIDERLVVKAEQIWKNFEKSETSWKRTVVAWASKMLDAIPFEENGLKTVPAWNTYMRKLKTSSDHIPAKQAFEKGLEGSLEPIEVIYPRTADVFRDFTDANRYIHKAAMEALVTHRKQMLWSLVGLPLTIPFALIPVIPNIPGFYLTYRVWSNWRALQAAKHLTLLVDKNQLSGSTLPELNRLYDNFKLTDSLNPSLANSIDKLFKDEHLRRELQQAVRQTRKQ